MLQDIPREKIDRVLFDSLRAIYQFEMAKERIFGLSFMDIYLLQYLRTHSPCRMGDIATEMNIPISTATRVIDRLEKKSYLGRKKDPEDKRNIRVLLKAKGEKIVREVEDHTYRVIMENLEKTKLSDIRAFVKTAASMPEILKTPTE